MKTELCPNCGVRFKRYIFKECPGCGYIASEPELEDYLKELHKYIYSKRSLTLDNVRGLAQGGNPYCNPYQSFGLGIWGGLMQAQPPRCPTCGR